MRIAVAIAIIAAATPAAAQSLEEDRFFVDKEDEDEEATLWQGNLTSSTFYFRESGGTGTALIDPGAQVDNASPFARMFTDLRAQLDARHLGGGRWDARFDGRARVATEPGNDPNGLTQDNTLQSGTFGGNEYELRDLYLVRAGRRTDFFIGRQTVTDLAAVKIDGLRLDYAASARWTYLGFAGLYPLRGSRSVTTDYPTASNLGANKTRPLPIAGGFGGAYRTQRTYGALGAVAIATPQRDPVTGTYRDPRVFVTANGYWRQGPSFDVYHFFVVDALGDAGFALTNATLGVQWKPSSRFRVNLSGHRIDAEVLDIQIRDRLEDATPVEGVVLNNVEIQRIAADSVRATASAGLGDSNRFELTTGMVGRRRPEVTLEAGTDDRTLPGAQAVEFLVQAVDRRFFGGVRLDALYTRTVGLGDSSYARSSGQLVRLGARRELGDEGQAELQGDVAFVQTADDDAGTMCVPSLEKTCYGTAETTALQANLTGYYRFSKSWFTTLVGGIASQTMTLTNQADAATVPQSTTVVTTAFFRLGYRF